MNVIALRGCGNVGKTNTLKQVIRILIDECGAHKLVEYVADNKIDTRVVLEIHGKIIVIFTGGDDRKTLDKNFESVRLHQFDLLICADQEVHLVAVWKKNTLKIKSFGMGKVKYRVYAIT